MFDKFGEFDSVEELNLAAEGLLKENDSNSLFELAKENGISREDTQDYIDGHVAEFATLPMAAMGRIKVIKLPVNPMEKMACSVILEKLQNMITDEAMQTAVMHKGKRIEKIYEAMKKGAEKHKSGGVGVSCGTDKQLREIIQAYYIHGENKTAEMIEKLYK